MHSFLDPLDMDYDPPQQIRRRIERCQCGDDLPGTCPGVAHCPYACTDDDE